MKLICPSCGATNSAETILADGEARAALMLAAELPGECGPLVLRYIGLFRPSTRALSWSRVLALLQELAPMIRAGTIRRDSRDWPAPPAAWRASIQQMLDRRDRLTLPMKSHGYLLDIIAGGADKAEAVQENQAELAKRKGQRPAPESSPVLQAIGMPIKVEDPTAAGDTPERMRHLQNVRNADVCLLAEKRLRLSRFKQDMTEAEGINFLRARGFSDAVTYEVIDLQRERTHHA